MGATCVVTPVSGHDEYVRHGVNALLCDWDDPRGTARQLDLLARDRDLLHELRRGALATAAAWPSWEQQSDEMYDALQRDRRRAGARPDRRRERVARRPAVGHRGPPHPPHAARRVRDLRVANGAPQGAARDRAAGALVEPAVDAAALRATDPRPAAQAAGTRLMPRLPRRSRPTPIAVGAPPALLELLREGPEPLAGGGEPPGARRTADGRDRDPAVPARQRRAPHDRRPRPRPRGPRPSDLAVGRRRRGPPRGRRRRRGDVQRVLRARARRRAPRCQRLCAAPTS